MNHFYRLVLKLEWYAQHTLPLISNFLRMFPILSPSMPPRNLYATSFQDFLNQIAPTIPKNISKMY